MAMEYKINQPQIQKNVFFQVYYLPLNMKFEILKSSLELEMPNYLLKEIKRNIKIQK